MRTDLADPALESKHQEYIHATGLVATCHHPATGAGNRPYLSCDPTKDPQHKTQIIRKA